MAARDLLQDMAARIDRIEKRLFGKNAERSSYLAVSAANTANPPTAAQLTTAFGAPATVGKGFTAFVDDANLHTNCYIVVSDGANWWISTLTKAV